MDLLSKLVEDLRQKAMFNESQRTYNALEWKAVAFEQKRIAGELAALRPVIEKLVEAHLEAEALLDRYREKARLLVVQTGGALSEGEPIQFLVTDYDAHKRKSDAALESWRNLGS